MRLRRAIRHAIPGAAPAALSLLTASVKMNERRGSTPALCAGILGIVFIATASAAPPALSFSARVLPSPVVTEPCGRAGQVCPHGTYWLHGAPVTGAEGARDAIVIEAGQVSTLSGCPRTPATITSADDIYVVTATWKRCRDRRNVTLEAAIDRATLGTLIGTFLVDIGDRFDVVGTVVLGEAIRIGTYNTKFLTSGPPASWQKNPPDAAEKISARILASRYDFIALEEVWDEDAKSDDDPYDGFVEALKATYPYYVQYVDGDQFNPHEDSGLMFFSRFPFQDLPHDTYQIDAGDCEASDCDKVAFYEFDSCDDDDCLAEKGAALVRLRNPSSGRIYNVVFTHLQAPYYDDAPDEMLATYETRAEQLGEIQTLLEATLDDVSFQREEIYVMGDLNIDGDLANPDAGAPPADPESADPFVHNKHEWARQFDTPGAFFTDTLTDTWANDTSPDDRGLSAPRNYEGFFTPPEGRLDFILRNANSRLCTQHLTLAHNLRWGGPYVESGLGQPGTEAGAMELSDHIGVTADINLPAPYCSARDPRVLSVPAGTVITPHGKIQHPGSMQWFRFDEPGTYGFATTGDTVRFHVYESTDLSMPMANYKGLERTATDRRGNQYEVQMFVVPKAPFYVRVFVPDYSGWTGSYKLVAKRYDCSSREDACLLSPQQEETRTFPGGTVVGDDDAMWFELHTESTGWDGPGGRVDTGQPQALAFEVDRIAPATSDELSMDVRAEDGATLLAGDTDAEADATEPDYATTPTDRLLATLDEPGPATRYIRVQRADPAVQQDFRVQWRTNLTVLHGSQVGVPNAATLDFSVADHGDAIGDEEYYFWLVADGQTIVDEVHLGDHSEPSNASLEPYVTAVRYVSEVHAIWVEVDNAYDGGYQSIDDDDVIEAHIGPLDPHAACVVGEHASMQDDEEYGKYYFSFNRCHGLPIP